jgi:hypothetical protein
MRFHRFTANISEEVEVAAGSKGERMVPQVARGQTPEAVAEAKW